MPARRRQPAPTPTRTDHVLRSHTLVHYLARLRAGGVDPTALLARFGLTPALAEQPEVETVVDILTMIVGSDRVLLCARLDFRDTLTAAELERACVRIDGTLRGAFEDLDEVFLEPVPRSDPVLRARVLARYGDILERDPRPAPDGRPAARRPAGQ